MSESEELLYFTMRKSWSEVTTFVSVLPSPRGQFRVRLWACPGFPRQHTVLGQRNLDHGSRLNTASVTWVNMALFTYIRLDVDSGLLHVV